MKSALFMVALQHLIVDWPRPADPCHQLCMISVRIACVGMDKHGAWSPVDYEPPKQSTSLVRGEGVDFEHCRRMRTDGLVEELIDSELRKFSSDAFMKFSSKLCLFRNRLHVVNMKVEGIVGRINRLRELVICR